MKPKELVVEKMHRENWEAVRAIYLEGIETGNATFEQTAPNWMEWDKGHLENCRFVAKSNGNIIGWSALSPVSNRCVYGGVAEVSVYVLGSARRSGVGSSLLKSLIEESESKGIWTLQAGIFPENEASIAIHKSCGFREVGRRERIGKMNGIWRDVILLERRSKKL